MMMNKRKIRDILRLICSICFSWLYIPHIIAFTLIGGGKRALINSDLKAIEKQLNVKLPIWMQLFYQLHNNRFYRTVFYFRIGPVLSALFSWYRPGDKYFTIGATTKIGSGFWFAHPYSTIIDAESIGDNFHCIHCTTIGNTSKGKPIIGNNVEVMANVVIAGKIHIGDNVTIGAGSVVTKDIPSNCLAAGVPAKVIKYKN